MCEHEWTIVHISNEPVGVTCSKCEESRPIAKSRDETKEFHIFSGGIYEIPMPDGRKQWQLNSWEVQNHLKGRSELHLEFLEYVPF